MIEITSAYSYPYLGVAIIDPTISMALGFIRDKISNRYRAGFNDRNIALTTMSQLDS
jgi:hypothetical protein